MQDEHLLVAAIAAGDEEALHQLYLVYRPRLRRYLWHQLDGNTQSVEEAMQDVFLAVWRTASGYRGEARVSTWLYQIAHYIALSVRRRLARTSVDGYAEAQDAADGEWGGPSYDGCDELVLNRVTLGDALSQLSPKHREVLALVFAHGFSLEETAHILDVPTGTVKSRISYARKALAQALQVVEARQRKEMRHDA